MSGFAGTLPYPAASGRSQAKTRVDHRNSEEAALVRRVQARDELAFREVVECYQTKIFSIIYGILRNHNDAEDIAQQVFSKVYFSIRNLDLQDHGERVLRLPAEKTRAAVGLRKRLQPGRSSENGSFRRSGGSSLAGGRAAGASRSGGEALVQ